MNTNAISRGSDTCAAKPYLFNNTRLEMESDNQAIFGNLEDIQSFSCLQQAPPNTEFSTMSCNEELIARTKKKATESLDDSQRCLLHDVGGISEESRRNKHDRNSKRIRSTDMRNAYERMRRNRIKDRMKALQELIPHSYKPDKISMLDDAIDYVKALKLQVKMLSDMGEGLSEAPGTTTSPNLYPRMGMFSTCQCGCLHMIPHPFHSANLQLQPSSLPSAQLPQMSAHLPQPPLRGVATSIPLPNAVSH